ncbi:MAG: General secretion pathway protein J [Burkholderiaceae bacterium]|jgi:general secretion pathway protein J|nr:MAG: General secretion pathway protein J [Burkholderiaceae bacterium]
MKASEMTSRRGQRPSANGFTLVELLVAIAILALLALLSWRGLDAMARGQARTHERADELLALQAGLTQWSDDLDALMQEPPLPAIAWDGRVLRLTRTAPSASDGMLVVAWTRRDAGDGSRWLRWQSPPLHTVGDLTQAWAAAQQWAQSPAERDAARDIDVLPLTNWQLYFFVGGAWTAPQSGAAANPLLLAMGAQNASVPDGVRLVLTLPSGHALAGTLTQDWVRPTLGGAAP